VARLGRVQRQRAVCPQHSRVRRRAQHQRSNVKVATSLLTWTCIDVIFFGNPSVIGAVQGMMSGLVCITVGAGSKSSLAPAVEQ
jgi:ammonia channel protein AmtB